MNEENKITPKQIAEAILQIKLDSIQNSPLSSFIPVQKQMLERQKQVMRAFRSYNDKLKELE